MVNSTGNSAITIDNGGECHVTNSFVGGGNLNHAAAFHVIDGSAEILYSTILSGFGTARALDCNDGSGTVVRNSLLVSQSDDPELVCPGVDITNSALEMAVADNVAFGDFDSAWMVPLLAQGDFSLSGAHPQAIDTAAVWTTGDPATDIHGDARPDVDGTEDFAGADRI